MPIFIHVNFKQDPLAARGERLGFSRRALMFFGWPVTFRAFNDDDVFAVPPRSIAYVQTFTDDELQKRQAAHEEAQKKAAEDNAKRSPHPGNAPRLVVPGGR